MDRAKLKGYGALALVFLLGILAGGAGSRAMLQRRYARLFRDRSSMFEHFRMGALAARLDLDRHQEYQVRSIMENYRVQRRQLTYDVMNQCGAPLRAQKARLDADIRALLRPEQQLKYDTLLKESADHMPPGAPLEPMP